MALAPHRVEQTHLQRGYYMKCNFNYLIILIASSAVLTAHAQQEDEQQQQQAKAVAQAQVTAEVATSAPAPVVIQTVPSLVKQQPITYVEASPLGESKADQLRKQRQDYEIQTEQKIVEKLEQSRLEDERNRAQKLFGGALNNNQQQEQAVPTYQVQQVPVQQVVVPQQQAAPADPPASQSQVEAAKNEILTKMVEQEKQATEAAAAKSVLEAEVLKEKQKQKWYVSGELGAGDYPDAQNIDGQWAGGFAVGYISNPNLWFEGSFVYSQYFIDQIWNYGYSPAIFKQLDQYNYSAALKYAFLTGTFKPYVGTAVSYTYRKYTDVMYYVPGYPAYGVPPDNSATTYAIDWGFMAGMAVQLTKDFYVGGEFRYFTNLTYRSNSALVGQRIYYNYGRPVEDFDYATLTFSGTFTF